MNSPNTSDEPLERLKLASQMPMRKATCDRHGEFDQKVLHILPTARPITSGCPSCAIEQAEEAKKRDDERRAEDALRRVRDSYRRSGIPSRFRESTFDGFVAESEPQKRALTFARAFSVSKKPGASLVLCGKPGTGKTHLACAVGIAMIHAEKSVLFSTAVAAIRRVKDTYRRDSEKSETQAMEELIQPDLLILDEIGVQLGTETEMRILFEVINERYANCMPTVLISNLDSTQLGDLLGERMMDRFREGGAIVAFDWPSYRGKK